MRKGAETVHILRKAKVDRLKPVYDVPQEFDIEGVHLIPAASNEAENGWVQIDGFTLVTKGWEDIRPDDQVVARGETYSVIGQPGEYVKRGNVKAVIATLRRSS